MKKLNIILLIFSMIFFIQCKKENTLTIFEEHINTNESISGNAYYDTDGDGIKDLPMVNKIVTFGDTNTLKDLYNNGVINGSKWEDLITTTTDNQGNYTFDNLEPSEGNGVMLREVVIFYGTPIFNVHGNDITIDGDRGETGNSRYIPVELEEEENDNGNNFVAEVDPTSMSGTVMLDLDGDLNTEDLEAYPNIKIRLYNDLPFYTPPIDSTTTDMEGKYEFIYHTELLRYRIELVLDDTLFIIQHRDISPDPDGATETGDDHTIYVSLSDNEHDEDNNFVLSEIENNCNEGPYILPYWAFCQTYNICDQESWPVVVEFANGERGIEIEGYHYKWTNHTTGETSTSDVIYIKESEQLSCTLMTPEGCEYDMSYIKICDTIQSFDGEWDLRKYLPNPWQPNNVFIYEADEVTWTFNSVDSTVTIFIATGIQFDGIDAGTYNYSIDHDKNIIINNINFGGFVTKDIAIDKLSINELSVDGHLLEFER